MSYRITIYCNDDRIYKTSAYIPNLGKTYSGTYGSSTLGEWKEFSVSGITGSARFSVEPESGCKFSYWAYRVGSTDGTLTYLYPGEESTTASCDDNGVLTYTGEQDIFIRAEGRVNKDETPWKPWSTFSIDNVNYEAGSAYLGYYDEDNNAVEGIAPYQLQYGRVTFSRSGYAHFYSVSDLDLVAFLSDEAALSHDWSEPASILAYDDESGDNHNFDIKYYVTAGKEYYLYVRGATGQEEGWVEVVATEPWSLNSSNYGTLSAAKTESVYVSPFTLYRRAVKFSDSGSVTISASGSLDTYGWVGVSSDFAHGKPKEYMKKDDDSGSSFNFSITMDVEAGEQYYIWFKSLEVTGSGTVTVNVTQPVGFYVPKWDWNKSNGTASDEDTKAAYFAATFQGETLDFSHDVWNDLVDKVKAILDELDLEWNQYYGLTYEETRMTAKPYELTAQKFNSLRYNVGVHYSTNIDEVSPGDDVLGKYITILASRINDWIDSQ